MINTIFYFVQDLPFADYLTMLNEGEIASHTIVFVSNDKTIYKDGVQYGTTSDADLLETLKKLIKQNPDYILPAATSTNLGAIKIGYPENQRNYAVRLDEETKKAYVTVPWDTQVGPKGDNGRGVVSIELTSSEGTNPRIDTYTITYTDGTTSTFQVTNGVIGRDGRDGAKGDKGDDGASGVRGNFQSRVFARSDARPTTPDGGSYDSPIPTWPAGVWHDSIPDGKENIWSSVATFYGIGGYSGWSTPTLEADTRTLDIEFSPSSTCPAAPLGTAASKDSQDTINARQQQGWYDPSRLPSGVTMIWRAERQISGNTYVGDWVITRIYGEKGDKGDPGAGGTAPAYDDSALQAAISALEQALNDANAAANQEKQRLNALINGLDESIRIKIEQLLDDADWVRDNLPENTPGGQSNFGQDDVEAYIQTLGIWAQNGDVTRTTWNTLTQTVSGQGDRLSSIEGRVTTLEGTTATGGNVNYSLLSSSLYAWLNDHYTESGMESTWAKFMQLSSDEIQMLKWMSSGCRSYIDTQSETAVAQLFAAARDYADNQTVLSQAAADVNALVEHRNGSLVAKSAMTAMVDDAITGIINTATSSNVGTQIFSQMQNEIDANETNIATIATKLSGDNSSASVATKIGNISGGFVTTTNLDSNVSSILSTGTSTYGRLTSAITSQVNTALGTAQQDFVLKNDLTSAYIVQKLNGNTSETTIKADKINVQGVLTAGQAYISQLMTDYLTGGNATFTGAVNATAFIAGSTNGLNITTTGDTIAFRDGNDTRAYFSSEGSGMQLHIKDSSGNWYTIDFAFWNQEGGSNAPANSLPLYKMYSQTTNGQYIQETKYIYYTNLRKCYTDYGGTTVASNSNTTGYYVKADEVNSITHDVKTEYDLVCNVMNAYGGGSAHYVLKQSVLVYYPVTFDSNGGLVIARDNPAVLINANINGKAWWATYDGGGLTTIQSNDVTPYNLSGTLDQISNFTSDSSYTVYCCNSVEDVFTHLGSHYTEYKVQNGHMTMTNY